MAQPLEGDVGDLVDVADITVALVMLLTADPVRVAEPGDRGVHILGGGGHGMHVRDMADEVRAGGILPQCRGDPLRLILEAPTEPLEGTDQLLLPIGLLLHVLQGGVAEVPQTPTVILALQPQLPGLLLDVTGVGPPLAEIRLGDLAVLGGPLPEPAGEVTEGVVTEEVRRGGG